ncbi:MAG: MotA/TolQ/ExbB proton channel family protein [Pirellulales bacterium]
MSFLTKISRLFLRSPLLWGTGLAFCFFALIQRGVIRNEYVVRYLAGHWVEYIEVGLFCVGLSSLAMKLLSTLRQKNSLATCSLPVALSGSQHPSEAQGLHRHLLENVDGEQGYLAKRLSDGLDFVTRTGKADDLEDHLKYLADVDGARAHASYGLVRFIVWAIPIMGFLGTVIGITVAIANLSPTELENISGVVAGLGTAFDTTATALALSMVLMFTQFVIERMEQSLLDQVDEQSWDSLAGRFQTDGIADGSALAVAKLGDAVGRSSAQLIEAQTQSWQELQNVASSSLENVFGGLGERLRETLSNSLGETLDTWSESLVEAHRQLASERDGRWELAGQTMADAAVAFDKQQAAVADQAAALEKVISMLHEIVAMEQKLESNLNAVTASGRFEEAIISLSAATQLLAARSSGVSGGKPGVLTEDSSPIEKVA